LTDQARLLDNDASNLDAPPPVLLPYQQQWIADESPLKVGEKSRRVGWTWAEAADDVLQACQAGGTNVFYIGPTQDMALEYIEACAMWARVFNFAAGQIEDGIFEDEDKDIKTYKIDFPATGRRIVALSSRPTNLRGKQGIVVVDEAAFHNDLKALLKAALAMLMWGDKVRVFSTHDGADSEFAELINEIRSGRRKGSVHKVTFREAVAQGLYRRVCMRRHIDWTAEGEAQWVADVYGFYGDGASEELDVIPSQGGGAFLSMALIESRMSADTPLVRGKWSAEFGLAPDDERKLEVEAWCEENLLPHLSALSTSLWHALGEDFGRVGDLTVMDLLQEQPNLQQRMVLRVELSNCPFQQQEQILFFILDRVRRWRAAALDRTGNGAYLAERAVQRYGNTRVEGVHLSEGWYLENLPRMKAALQDDMLNAIPKDVEGRDDLRALRIIDGVPKLPKAKTQHGEGPKLQRHGDSAISLALAHYAMRREVVPMEFQALGVGRATSNTHDYMQG
jgi:phage FluMu gp28-like protein